MTRFTLERFIQCSTASLKHLSCELLSRRLLPVLRGIDYRQVTLLTQSLSTDQSGERTIALTLRSLD